MNFKESFCDQVAAFMNHADVWARGGVVAVSGGPDSVALLRALVRIRPDSNIPLVVAHMNHGLRGVDSDADECFVEELAGNLQRSGVKSLYYHGTVVDLAMLAREHKDNLENAGRRVRYSWLTRIARENNLSWVATGHTADDQAETVLHRIVRGSGLAGIRGIAPRRNLDSSVTLLRPLLTVEKREVLSFLGEARQNYQTDHSNIERRFFRNRIRHELLPGLQRELNPSIPAVLCRLGEQARQVYKYREEAAEALLRATELPRAGNRLIFDARSFSSESRSLLREMFRMVWRREAWREAGMKFDHWDNLVSIALGNNSSADFCGGIHASHILHVFRLEPKG